MVPSTRGKIAECEAPEAAGPERAVREGIIPLAKLIIKLLLAIFETLLPC